MFRGIMRVIQFLDEPTFFTLIGCTIQLNVLQPILCLIAFLAFGRNGILEKAKSLLLPIPPIVGFFNFFTFWS